MFCIKCGRDAEVGNFCEKCYLSMEKLFDIKDFNIILCDCGAYYDRKWNPPTKDLISEQILKNINSKNKIKISVTRKEYGNRITIFITAKGIIPPAKTPKEETKKITITIKKKKCDECIKLSGGYYEALVQIRGEKADKLLEKFKSIKGISSIERNKDGYDIKLLDKKKVSAFLSAREIEFKKSYKFVTTKKDKKLYRDVYSIR